MPELPPTLESIHPSVTTEHPTVDPNAGPLFGSDSLQRAFAPDPHTMHVTAGG
jgi:hypothetical protein